MSMLSRLRDRQAEPEPSPVPHGTPEPTPSGTGCMKCLPAPLSRGPRFGGHVAARGRGVPTDNGLRLV